MTDPTSTVELRRGTSVAVMKVIAGVSCVLLMYVLSSAPLFRLVSTSGLVDAAVGRARAVEIWEFAYVPVRRLLETPVQPALLGWADVWSVEPAFRSYTRRARISNNLRRIGLAIHTYSSVPASPIAVPQTNTSPPTAPSSAEKEDFQGRP